MSTPTAGMSRRETLRTVAPLLNFGLTWGVRKGMIKAYESRTGRPAPLVHTRNGSVLATVAWAASIAAVLALVETLVIRALAEDDE
jgi:hypothetical protein